MTAPAIEITARLDEDGRHVRGVLRAPAGTVFADPLAALGDPPSDLHAIRTFPVSWDHGAIDVTPLPDGALRFVATLPDRFGPIGATKRGTFANGAWYPQPLDADGLVRAHYHVTLTLPDGVVGALGPRSGTGTLRFDGEADRVPLAAIRGGELTPLAPGVDLLSRGRPGKRLLRELRAAVPAEGRGVVARAPLRRRLTSDGPGLVYLSDRAMRVTPGLEPAHRRGVAQGLAAGLSGLPDDFDRDFVGAAATRDTTGVRRLLGVFRWVPQINWLLTSQRIPFWAETTGQIWPADPVKDDLSELYAPHWPGAAAVETVVALHGVVAADAVADSLRAGSPPPVDLTELRRPPPLEDLRLRVDGSTISLHRSAVPGAADRSTVLRIDGADQVVALPAGDTTLFLPLPPRRVAVDPGQTLPQTSRVGDVWPPRWDVTFAGWIDAVNLSRGQVFLGGQSTLRRMWNTRDLYIGTLYNSQSDLVGARVGWLRKEGGLLDGISRPLRLRFDVGGAWLDPSFAPLDGGAMALDATASVAYDDRVALDFPLRGERVGLAVGGGLIPGSTEVWTNAGIHALGVTSWHPRVAVGGRLTANVASSTATHRLLQLGGDSGIRAVPALPACPDPNGEPCLPVASSRATGVLELRTVPLRNASVPGGIAWGTEIQVNLGVEGLVARANGPVTATGVTLTALGLADVFGVDATSLGLTAAFLTSSTGLPLPDAAPPELYLRFGQSF